MKNKKLIYVLIPLVAIVWGLIIWKVAAFRPEQQPASYDLIPHVAQPADTSRYELKLNYRDPFLRSGKSVGATKSASSTKKRNNVKKVKLNSVKGPVKPTNLVYRGLISCNENRVGLLEVDGQKRLIKKQSIIGEYHIVAVETDSLRIRFMDKEYVYGKQ